MTLRAMAVKKTDGYRTYHPVYHKGTSRSQKHHLFKLEVR